MLTVDEFERLKTGAEVLEKDAHGIKVLRMPNGDILKLFRVKHLISSAKIYSHARSFCKNATRLHALGIPTVTIKALYKLEGTSNSAVIYQPLEGTVLRHVARAEGLNDIVLHKLGVFIAKLHANGIFFRSLHLGNIVLTNSGELGLIDVADLGVRPWSLIFSERLRNFRHVCRLDEDRKQIGLAGWIVLGGAYQECAGLSVNSWLTIQHQVAQWFSQEGMVKKL